MKTPVKIPDQIREAIAEACDEVARKSREGRISAIAMAAVEPVETLQNGDVRNEVMLALIGDERPMPVVLARMAAQRKDFTVGVLDRLFFKPWAMIQSLPFIFGFAGGLWFDPVVSSIANWFMH